MSLSTETATDAVTCYPDAVYLLPRQKKQSAGAKGEKSRMNNLDDLGEKRTTQK